LGRSYGLAPVDAIHRIAAKQAVRFGPVVRFGLVKPAGAISIY